MSTLLRTNGSASKLISGFHPLGAMPKFPPPALVKAVSIKDRADKLLTGQSLQEEVSNQANAISVFSGVRSVKPISVVSRRYAHTDVSFPNFEPYRHDSTKDPSKSTMATDDMTRVTPTALFYGVGGAVSIFLGKDIVQSLAGIKGIANDQMALGSIEIDLNEVPEGVCKTFEWRGKPVFVRHRTEKEIAGVRSVKVDELRHPQTDESRVIKPEWSILIGICTHLGCVPFANMGEFDGYYCPCHGSHYDASGRIRKGPAPLNLVVPEYSFPSETVVKLG